MRLVFLLAAALSSCATISTAGMTEHCQRLYNACLNSCPQGSSVQPAGTMTNGMPQMDVASCTHACNQRARECK